MEPLLNPCDDAQDYPRNIADGLLAPYAVDAIRHKLHEQAHRLLTDEAKAAIDFLDLGHGAKGMINVTCSNCTGLSLMVPHQIFGRSTSQMRRA